MRESLVYGVLAQLLYIAWIVLMICEVKFEYASSIAWLLYLFKTILLTYCRTAMRNKYNIWGCTLDDMWACLVWYPFVCAQLQIQAETDGEGAQAYFADVDAAILVNTRSEAAKENRVAKSVA